ncbi:histone-lysine N-methyltransferase SETMAR [Trichonephila clavipes]|nr:histone-lysine N-methyltransferase SETMAR [Trichonephila clavipes]
MGKLSDLDAFNNGKIIDWQRMSHSISKIVRQLGCSSGHNSLQDEEHTEGPRLGVIPDNVSGMRKLLMDGNRCTYQIIQKELNFGSTAIYKIIHEELLMKKVVCL